MARYADTLLADGEHVALRSRQHLLATIIEGRVPWVLLILALVLIFLDLSLTQGMLRDVFGLLGLGLLLVALVWLGYIYMSWLNQDYLVTNRRVIKVEGILSKRSADSSLEKINDAVLQQSLFGRMLGYGDLDIMTAAEESVDRYRMLSQAQTFKRTMLDEKHKLEQEAFQIPAPPLRAAPPPAEPVAQPAMAAPRQMTSDEITGALGNLADLRDRGAISPEEYEAKKQDLLGRL
ncbi:MAG TPA: PH domain-containing protein [Patescibacteria group bacterium]|nr:PH domain-containing protein [Patescibacteria group bacterium]